MNPPEGLSDPTKNMPMPNKGKLATNKKLSMTCLLSIGFQDLFSNMCVSGVSDSPLFPKVISRRVLKNCFTGSKMGLGI